MFLQSYKKGKASVSPILLLKKGFQSSLTYRQVWETISRYKKKLADISNTMKLNELLQNNGLILSYRILKTTMIDQSFTSVTNYVFEQI